MAALACSAIAEIPSYIKVCSKSEPNLEKCIINSVNLIRPKLEKGIPELHVPGIEPLLLDEIQMRSGPSQAKIDANITNVRVWGPSKFEVLDLKADVKRHRFIVRAKVPLIHFKGDYDIDMSILVLKYKGKGPITGNFTDYQFDCTMKGDLKERNGKKYLQFRKFGLDLIIGHSDLRLGNLFSGPNANPTLARATNEVVRENADLFVNEIKPVLESSLAQKFTDIANSITQRFTYDELFPEK